MPLHSPALGGNSGGNRPLAHVVHLAAANVASILAILGNHSWDTGMTILNWEMTAQHVLILSDTLAIGGQDKRARHFTTKVYPAPHIEAVITGTGLHEVATRFYMSVVGGYIVDDVEHLSDFAPETLREIWKGIGAEIPGATATIYTFGLSQDDGNFTGYAYRSTADFEAERMKHGIAVKPGTPTAEDLQRLDGLPAFIAVSRKQQAHDRGLPRGDRVGIGGDLWMYLLTKTERGSLSIRIERLERLEHYADDREIMLAQIPGNESHPLSIAALARDP